MGLTVTKDLYCDLYTYLMGGYSIMMLAMPGKMVTDNFNAPATPMTEFWIRGSSVAGIGMCYFIKTGSSQDMFDVALLMTIAIATLYPFNAKFGYLTNGKLPTKYTGFPNHYFAEVSMSALIGLGLYIKLFA